MNTRRIVRKKKYPPSFHAEVQKAVTGFLIPMLKIPDIYRAAENAFDVGLDVTHAVKLKCKDLGL